MTRKGAAFFDVDGTLLRSTVIHYFVFLKTSHLSRPGKLFWMLRFLPKIPYYWVMDQFSREVFNRRFYGNYRGMSPAELSRSLKDLLDEFMRPRMFPAAVQRIERHRREGDQVVLVSGSLKQLIEPLARQLGADAVYAPELAIQDSAFTGQLVGKTLTSHRKAECVRKHIEEHGLDSTACHVYADSLDDLPMLEVVGCAAVVNPGRRLKRIAAARDWEILSWKPSNM